MIEFLPSLRTFAVHCNWNLSNLGGLIIWYLDTSLLCVASFSLASCDVTALINFTVLLCIIFMRMFYRVMKRIHQFAANFLSYIPTKYYWNRSTSDLVIAKSKRVNFFLKHSVHSNGFSPEWIQLWSVNSALLRQHVPHSVHLYYQCVYSSVQVVC